SPCGASARPGRAVSVLLRRHLGPSLAPMGRYLFVVFRLDPEHWAHAITAREMDRKEKRHYRTRMR
ncbi:MAG TPA: hypothetical protein PLD23_14395, partial [Armatimonadota bacterium]|nr:hypothetical protein [Armatimonadota bacterium]